MILHPEDNRGGGRVSTTAEEDFQPLATYSQTSVQNEAWVNVTLTTTHSDGSKSQTFYIAKK